MNNLAGCDCVSVDEGPEIMGVQTILDQIKLSRIALPQFQRGYVWNCDRVRGLVHSLYRKYLIGSHLG
jgi:uncharacterized protein with ParB-like and HNH nuclease domain